MIEIKLSQDLHAVTTRYSLKKNLHTYTHHTKSVRYFRRINKQSQVCKLLSTHKTSDIPILVPDIDDIVAHPLPIRRIHLPASAFAFGPEL